MVVCYHLFFNWFHIFNQNFIIIYTFIKFVFYYLFYKWIYFSMFSKKKKIKYEAQTINILFNESN